MSVEPRRTLLSGALDVVRGRSDRGNVLILAWRPFESEIAAVRGNSQPPALAWIEPETGGGTLEGDRVPLRPGGEIVFAGPGQMIPAALLLQLAYRGRWRVHSCELGQWRSQGLVRLLVQRGRGAVLDRLRALNPEGRSIRLLTLLRGSNGLRAVWRHIFPGMPTPDLSASAPSHGVQLVVPGTPAVLRQVPVPRRIVMASAGLPAGGAERQILEAVRALASAGLTDLTVLGPLIGRRNGADFMADSIRQAGASVETLPMRFRAVRDGFSRDPVETADLLSSLPADVARDVMNYRLAFRECRPAVVHAWQDDTAATAGLAAVLEGVPRVVLAFRNQPPPERGSDVPWLGPLLRALARSPDVEATVNSFAGRGAYAAWLGLPVDRVRFIPNAVTRPEKDKLQDLRQTMRTRLKLDADTPVVGGVFRAHPNKRSDLWLEAICALADRVSDLHAVYVGEGPELAELLACARRRLGDRFHRFAPEFPVAGLMAGFDVLLHTSRVEGTPNVVLEAQALGIPVVATTAGDTARALGPESGTLFERADAHAISGEIFRLLNDPVARRTAGDAGQAYVARSFGVDAMLSETLAAYGAAVVRESSK